MKKSRKELFKHIRIAIIFFLVQLLILYFFLVEGMYINREADSENTYQIEISVDDVTAQRFTKGPAVICIYSGSQNYRLTYYSVNGKHPKSQAKAVCEKIKQDGTVTAIVRKDRFKLRFRNRIVDLRSNDNVYYDINDFNKVAKSGRISSVVAFVIFEILFILTAFVYTVFFRPKRKKKNKTQIASASWTPA